MTEADMIEERSSEKLRGRARRSRNLSTKLTAREADAVEEAASREGKTPSEWARDLLLGSVVSAWLRSYFFFLQPVFFRSNDIDDSGVERGFDVHRVIFLNHPDARATVLSDLIDVGSLHQPQADIRVP